MNRGKAGMAIFSLMLTAMLLQGCWDVKDIDTRAIASGIGIKQSDHNQIEVWIRFPTPQASVASSGGGGNGASFFTLKQQGETVVEALDQLRFKLSKSLDLTSVRVVFIDQEIAAKGAEPFLEFAIRDRTIPLNTIVAIVSGPMEDIFMKQNPTGEAAGVVAKQYFETYAGGTPKKNKVALWKLFSRFYNPLEDNLIPVIKPSKETQFELEGNAFFSGGKMKGILSPDETLIYEMIVEKMRDSEIETTNGKADVRILRNNSEIQTWLSPSGKPVIRVTTELTMTLIDKSYEVRTSEREMEQSIDHLLDELARKVVAKTQQHKADIFGFGNHFRGVLRPEQHKDWPELYQAADIEVHVHSQLRNTGLRHLIRK